VQLDNFQTLADPMRRRILAVLRSGEQQVNDVVAELDIHQSGVSRHLRILLDTGFVQVRPDGQRRYYSLRPEPFRDLHAWLDDYRDLWEARLDRFGKALEAKQRAKKKSKSAQEKKR
jgi:DNA-binding transcriptional ArsR family regulator